MEKKAEPRENRKTRPIRVSVADISADDIPARGEEGLEALAASIARHGLLQPPVIRREPDGKGFLLVSGVRRLAACRMLGLKAIDAMLMTGDQEEAAACYLEERFTCAAPSVMDEAALIGSVDAEKLIGRFALDRRLIEKRLYLLALPERIRRIAKAHALSLDQVLPLLSISQEERQMEAAYLIAERGLTAQQARRLAGWADSGREPRCGRRRAVRTALREADNLVARMRALGISSSVSVYAQEQGLCIQIMIPKG